MILSDGDSSTLANLKLNLEMNEIANFDSSLDQSTSTSYLVRLNAPNVASFLASLPLVSISVIQFQWVHLCQGYVNNKSSLAIDSL